jgi:hypothetical protein
VPPQRVLFLQSTRSPRESGYSTPSMSGTQTPRELKEEKWRLDAQDTMKPGKAEMRGFYKELGGRKARGKNKLGGIRDKGGWDNSNGEW